MLGRLGLGGASLLIGVLQAAAGTLTWGANGHPFTAYPGIDYGRQLDYLADLGMTSYRVNVSETAQIPALRQLAEEGRRRGIDILPVLTPKDADLDGDGPETLYATARQFVVDVATPLKDAIRVWELGNELEIYAILQPCETRDDGSRYPCEWGPAGGVGRDEYYTPRWRKVSAVLKGLSDGLASVDPDLKAAMGTAGWGHLGAFERMKEDGIDWDITVWHMYGADPEWAFQALKAYGRPIWVTEFNHPAGSQNGEAEQAEGLTRWMKRLADLADLYDVEAAHVYQLLDEPYWEPSHEAHMGLVRVARAGSGWALRAPKPAYEAVREAIRGPRPSAVARRSCDLARAATADRTPQATVESAYCVVLGRTPDPAGAKGWVDRLRSGEIDIPTLVLAMMASREFHDVHFPDGMSDDAYVRFMFRLLLGRDVDGHGLASYVAELKSDRINRDHLVQGIVLSDEFRKRFPALTD
ncbi:DUF4214 domain-containing protein [Chthonobacter rhizosphaerae]|uniref:DUF4214 domain-containing protein n=1 Tax=Chthonobacter rhizosphaerae TaxID=2735553 RepID=UPI0015EE81CF|nr:DUF4214 domain-containing protein [Chthonobacter rhizosphaerae]